MDLVPVVDISDPTSTSLSALDTACRDHGFFLLEGHGLDGLFATTFAAARRFFDADRAVKEAVRRDGANPMGYNDRELTKRLRDHKEVLDLLDPAHPRADAFNRWPEIDGFRDAMSAHFDACSELADRAVALVLDALGLVDTDTRRGDRTTSSMRLNRYTVGDPVPAGERDGLADLGDVALGHHTDSGVLTLLLQDDAGGLQAQSPEHGWIDVEPRPGTIVVNLADCMQVWTNDRYRAAVHQVTTMGSSDRLSIPYFSNPRRDCIVEAIPDIADGPVRYRPFSWREFIAARGADNYADVGAPDAQISDFRIVDHGRAEL
jgi:isopenicillin N synthase-like dioxygenase